jgi:hypothetical protein
MKSCSLHRSSRAPRLPALLAAGLTILTAACQRPAPPGADPRHVEIIPAGSGAVDGVVRQALANAQRDGRRLLVYVSAPWCQPCERFQAAVRAGTLDARFPDLRLLMFDHDRDSDRLAAAGYGGRMIPRFVVPNPDGRGSRQRMEGGTKNEDTVATSISPRLSQLLGIRPAGPESGR